MKKIVLAAALFGAATTANAGFVASDLVAPVANTIPVSGFNDFVAPLAGLGVTTYTVGASLAVDQIGSVSYYYYAKEGWYNNTFTSGVLSYSTGYTDYQDSFGSPVFIGTQAVTAGVLDFNFCARYPNDATLIGCITNTQNDLSALNDEQSIALNINGDTAWIFWDDSGKGPDDDHDDMIIKAVFTPVNVPEPGSLALFGLGLVGLGLGYRARRAAKK